MSVGISTTDGRTLLTTSMYELWRAWALGLAELAPGFADDDGQPGRGPGRLGQDLLVGVAEEVAEQREPRGPQDTTERVGHEEARVVHSPHPGQPGDHGPEEGGEPAEHDGPRAPAPDEVPSPLHSGLPAPERPDREQPGPDQPPDLVADRVPGDR